MSNESMWSGTFGDSYTVRNDKDYSPRDSFWEEIVKETRARRVLEVGCNTGMNLASMGGYGPPSLWGIDINKKAIAALHSRHPDINAVVGSGYDLPFRDDYFDLVFTCGVLIHQRVEEVEAVMQEIIRVSGEYVLAVEYSAESFEEVPYRGNAGSLFKGPFGDIYTGRYGLRLVETGFLGKTRGFDDCTYWLLSKI